MKRILTMKHIIHLVLCALLVALSACTSSSTDSSQIDSSRIDSSRIDSSLTKGRTLHPLAATAYYVDGVSGNDALAGTSTTTAWRTIAKLNSRTFGPGDTINLKRGSVFSGTVLTIQQDGTSGAPITVRNYGSGNLPVVKNPNQLYALEVKGDWVTVDGVSLQDTTKIASWPAGYADSGAILVRSGADNVTVKNSEFTNVGLGVKTYGLGTTITGNNFHDLVIAYTDSFQSYGAVGVSLNNSNAVVSYNTFTNCRSTNTPYGADGGAVEIEGLSFNKDNIWIHHNKSSGSQGFLEVTETASSNVTLSYNISDDYQQFVAFDTTTVPSNFKVEHNTIIRTRTANAVNLFAVFYYREVVATPNDSWLSIRNNVFYSPAAKVLKGTYTYTDYNFPHDHNLYFFNGADPVGYPLGEGDIVADPKFTSNFSDLRLTASSAAINAGLNLGYTLDFANASVPFGGTPDLGAYEFQGSPSSGTNLIADPGFEVQGSDALASPWVSEGAGSKGVDRSQNKQRSGQNNGWIATTGSEWNVVKQLLNVTPNSNYRLSVWIRNSGNFNGGYFGTKNTGGGVIREVQYAGASGYAQLSIEFNSGATGQVCAQIGYYGIGSLTWQQMDDWSLIKL